MNIANHLITIPNSTGHVSYFQSNAATWQDSVQNTSCQFLYDNVICPTQTNIYTLAESTINAEVYPNPASADMTIRLSELPSSYSVAVYDNMGREVYRAHDINDAQYTLPRQDFAAGAYFLNIQFNDNVVAPIRSKIIFR